MTMKQLHFYELGNCGEFNYLKDWVNWTGEIPLRGDVVLMHFGDYNEHEEKYRVMSRVIDGTSPDDINVFVRKLRTLF